MFLKLFVLVICCFEISLQLRLVHGPEVNSFGETFNDPSRSSFATSRPHPLIRERYCFPKGWPDGVLDWRAGYRCLFVECMPLDYACPTEDTFTFHRKCMACNFMRDLDRTQYIVPHYDYETNDFRIP